jgi:arylsulfatase A-like enzyme
MTNQKNFKIFIIWKLIFMLNFNIYTTKFSLKNKSKLPNVIIVVIDDAGVADTGFSAKLFNKEYSSPILTPFIDSLADESIKLLNYYTHPTCTPSRISLMTGTYAYMHGLPFAITGNSGANPPIGLDPDKTTLGEMFQSLNYKTHLIGKWHLGHSREIMQPPKRGFNTFYGLMGGAFDHYKKTSGKCVDLWYYDDEVMNKDKKMIRVPITEIDIHEHATKLFSNKAIEMIDSHNINENFFLYLAYTAPHDPLQADKEYIEKCNHISNESRKIFCAMMLQLDYELSRVVQRLKERKLWEDTILVFTTDNGAMPIVGGYNYPFRGMKSDSWEGGVRGPAFIRIPENFYPNESKSYRNSKGLCFDGLFHISDWLPTLKGILKTRGAEFNEALYTEITGVDQSEALINQGPQKYLLRNDQCISIYEKTNNMDDYFVSKNFPRQTLVPQADIFMNAIAVRKGCYKIIIGRPGGNNIYKEGDAFLSVKGEDNNKETKYLTELNRILYDYGLSTSVKLIDYLVERKYLPVNTDMFYKCGVQNFIDMVIDWLEDRKYHSLTASSDYIKFLNEKNRKLLEEHKLNQTPKNEDILDFVFTNGTTNKFQNNQPPLTEDEYNTVLMYNVCEDPSEVHDMSKMSQMAEKLNQMYEILIEEVQKAPPQFAGDAASKKAGQTITILRDDGSKLNIDLPDSKSNPEKECELSHLPFVPDDLSLSELARIYDQGDFFRTLPDKVKKIWPFG